MRSRFSVVLVAAIAMLAPAACGSSSSPTSSTGTTSGTHTMAVKFADCMRSHGVTAFPDPNPSGGFSFPTVHGITQSPGFRSAQRACQRFVPSPPTSQHPISPAQVALMQADGLRVARCLRAHGVPSFPDPTFTSTPDGSFTLHFSGPVCKLDLHSPAFVAAVKACPAQLGGNFELAFIHAQQTHGATCGQ